MAGILEEIKGWARGLKYWEQAALEKIATQPKLTEDDYKELVTLWEQDAGLAPLPTGRPRLRFSEPVDAVARPRTRLSRLFNLTDVNALPPGQELPFSTKLTLVYGANGAGKTGYARPLGCAAFTRGDTEVLPNAEDDKPGAVPSADIEILVEGQQEPSLIHWEVGQRRSELAGFYVFDSGSPDAHLLRPNAMSVTPSALGPLTRLADETDEVRRRLRAVIDQRAAPHTFGVAFQGDSPVSHLIAKLGPSTELTQIRALAAVTEEDKVELERLEKQLAQLKLQTNAQRLESKRQELTDLTNLIRQASEATGATDETNEAAAQKLIENLQECQRAAEQFGSRRFACESLSQVGTHVWREFILAARNLAQAEERASGTPYPHQDAPCLLCQQPLSETAADLINKLWQFLASDAQKRLENAQRACGDRIRQLEAVPLNYFAKESSIRRLLEAIMPNAVPAVEAHTESAAARIRELAGALREGRARPLPPLVCFDSADLQRLIEIQKAEVRKLEESEEGERLMECESALRGLQHRKTLAVNLQAIEDYVRGRKWAYKAARELGTTAHITRKYNELFESLVTERYKAAFDAVLHRFGRNLRVSPDTSGRKAETIRQIVLRRADFPSGLPIAKVLSDGEKRAVALADFLAEASTDDSCDGLILDDPVTSLDAGWKKELAAYLVERVNSGRQVVVFTHDLPFLYHIRTKAAEFGIEPRAHWVQKRNNRPGFLFADNSPVCERDFKTAKHAEEHLQRSEKLPPAEQQRALEEGFDALRTSYEALVVFELFNGVVQRFDERLRLDLLKEVNFDSDVAREITARWAELSRYIGAHLHSDTYAPEKPSPEKLREEIDAFKDLRRKIKELRKNQAPGSRM